jgi:hypothetical protein
MYFLPVAPMRMPCLPQGSVNPHFKQRIRQPGARVFVFISFQRPNLLLDRIVRPNSTGCFIYTSSFQVCPAHRFFTVAAVCDRRKTTTATFMEPPLQLLLRSSKFFLQLAVIHFNQRRAGLQ